MIEEVKKDATEPSPNASGLTDLKADTTNLTIVDLQIKHLSLEIDDTRGTDIGWRNFGPSSPYILYNDVKVKI